MLISENYKEKISLHKMINPSYISPSFMQKTAVNTVLALIFLASAVMLIGGTAATNTILLNNIAYAQTVTLGEPYFVEKGKSTAQGEIGPNMTRYTFTANGTMNGNIEVTDTGEFVTISKGNNLFYEPGQGVITTKDGSETANYTSMDVGNNTDYVGAAAYSTNSTGELSFLNNILGIYKGTVDENGNFELSEWIWK